MTSRASASPARATSSVELTPEETHANAVADEQGTLILPLGLTNASLVPRHDGAVE